MKTSLLEKIGLTKSEIAVYLAMLELGSSTTGKIVDKSKIASSKIYEVLDKLMAKGLASFIIKSGVKYYEAAPPERIRNYIGEREKEILKQKNEIEQIIPELELKRKLSKYKSEATIYKGIKGVETAFYSALDLMKPGEEFYAIGIPTRSEAVNRFFVKYSKERAKRKVAEIALFNEKARGQIQTLPENRYEKDRIRYIPQITPAAITIFKERVIIFPESREPLLFVIDSKEVADSFKVQFDMWWSQDTFVAKGIDAMKKMLINSLDDVKPGESWDVLGAGLGPRGAHVEYAKAFKEIHAERVKKGMSAKLLFQQGSEKTVDTYRKELYQENAALKFLPYNTDSPVAMFPYEDYGILLIEEKEPTIIKINNKEVAKSFRNNFETMWDQEVYTYNGQKSVESVYEELIEKAKAKDQVIIFAAKPTTKEGADYTLEWNRRLRKRVESIRLLYYGFNKANIQRAAEISKVGCETKIVHTDESHPISTIVLGDTVINTVWQDSPIAFKIENKTVADSFRTNFDMLWNQEVFIDRGLTGVHNAWNRMLDSLKKGEEYYALGVAWHGTKDKLSQFFIDFHKERQRRGIKAKFLFVSGTEDMVRRVHDTYYNLGEVKFLPQGIYEGIQINIYKGTVLLFVWREKEPIVFTFKDEKLFNTFMSYFNSLWDQETKIVKGAEAIVNLFEDIIDNGGCDWIGARGYAIDAIPSFVDDWEKRAISKGIKIRNIVDPEVKGHRITKFPFAKTKYSIKKEFSMLSCIWIYKDKVVISNWMEKEPIAMIIENKGLCKMYEQQFELLWNEK